MHRSAWEGQSQILGLNKRIFKALDKDNLNKDEIVRGFDNTTRQEIGHRPNMTKSFVDSRRTFTDEQMKKDTARCLGCGATIIDQNRCIGCGICTTKCKFDAISLNHTFDAPEYLFADIDRIVEDGKKLRVQKIAVRLASEGK